MLKCTVDENAYIMLTKEDQEDLAYNLYAENESMQ